MASRSPLLLTGKVGRLGNTVFYTSQGRTIQKPLSAVSNPRTPLQMARRIVWPNIVRFNTLNSTWNKKSFERRKPGVHDYQLLMQSNLESAVRVFVPKQLIRQGACVVAPYLLTQGSLPHIVISEYNGSLGHCFPSNISLGTFTWREDLTIGEVSQAIIKNNSFVKEGWQLSLIRLTQSIEAGIPVATCRTYEIKMLPGSTEKLYDYMPKDMLGTLTLTDGSPTRLAVLDTRTTGGFALLWSRSEKGKTYVSTQSVVMMNSAVLDQYTSEEAYMETLASYNTNDVDFLQSGQGEGDVRPIDPTPEFLNMSMPYATAVDAKVGEVRYTQVYGQRVTTVFKDKYYNGFFFTAKVKIVKATIVAQGGNTYDLKVESTNDVVCVTKVDTNPPQEILPFDWDQLIREVLLVAEDGTEFHVV